MTVGKFMAKYVPTKRRGSPRGTETYRWHRRMMAKLVRKGRV